MAVLEPRLAVLDETDSGLDVDALRDVAGGVNALRSEDRAIVLVTHYQRLLNHITPDFVHILGDGRIVKSGGRELALVTVTGAITAGSGPGSVRTAASIDVVDPSVPRVAATIPLGLAGPSFEPIAIDATGRLALVGATSRLALYGVDLAPLDDPALYAGGASDPPVVLDGSTPGFRGASSVPSGMTPSSSCRSYQRCRTTSHPSS